MHARQTSGTAPERPLPASGLAVMTCLGALDGTIVILAAQGTLSTWTGAIGVGLTVIAGAGAWIAARQAFSGRHLTSGDYALLGALALATSLITALAAGFGAWIGSTMQLMVLPRAVGLILLLIAADMGGIRLPKAGAPLPIVATASAVVLEGIVQWTH